ncbi:MAG: LLM class flavin-dependent oxidoreductase [Acidimicrobiia bacterium]|nr:LLM class flavin-dependent oxidoreductase [Acidimicrobiia bacterium]
MKVGVLQFFSWPERRVPLPVVYERALARIDVMDRTGYDAVWLAEHHFSTYSVCPSVHLMGMHVAARTTQLRVGTAVTLAAFHHPLRIAEEVAMLDVLSGGRVNWGAGRGFDRTEYAAFDVADDESYPLFRENVAVVLDAWRHERLSFEGRFHRFEGVEVLPKPVQQPHPPTWLAASSPEAVEWSASQGHSILMDPHASHSEIARKRALWQSTLEAAGFSSAGRDIPMARLVAVAPTTAEAEEVARRGASWMIGSYANPAKRAVVRGDVTEAGRPGAQADPVQRYVDDVIVWGTPTSVVDQLGELAETMPLDYLLAAPLSHQSFELLTDEVLPKVA